MGTHELVRIFVASNKRLLSQMKLLDSVPKSFKLGAHTIKVVIQPDSDYDKSGLWIEDECEIRLYPKGRKYSYMMVTFYHELAHAIESVFGTSTDEEERVDKFGQGLAQFAATAKYDVG